MAGSESSSQEKGLQKRDVLRMVCAVFGLLLVLTLLYLFTSIPFSSPIQEVHRYTSPNTAYCSAETSLDWQIPYGKYLLLFSELGPRNRWASSRYYLNATAGVLCNEIPFDEERMKVLLVRENFVKPVSVPRPPGSSGPLYTASTVYEGIHETLSGPPYEGILGIDRNGSVCISLPEFANVGRCGYEYYSGERTFRSLFAEDSRPILLKRGEPWYIEVTERERWGQRDSTKLTTYRITNYGFMDQEKIGLVPECYIPSTDPPRW